MLKHSLKRALCFALIALTMLSLSTTGLADSNVKVKSENKDGHDHNNIYLEDVEVDTLSAGGDTRLRYTNPDTGYEAVVLDDYELLTSWERNDLLNCMKPLTEFGNIAFWSTDVIRYSSTLNGKTTNATSHMEIARLKRRDLFEFKNASLFMINMSSRKLVIQSYGYNYSVITNSRANIITNNIRVYATLGNYYEASKGAMTQMYALFEGGRIPQPMKYMSNLCISLMLGLLVGLLLVLRSYDKLHARATEKALLMTAVGAFSYSIASKELKRSDEFYSPPISSGGYGGSSCSSCGGGGSSGSSCGGCGGGGSSSF